MDDRNDQPRASGRILKKGPASLVQNHEMGSISRCFRSAIWYDILLVLGNRFATGWHDHAFDLSLENTDLDTTLGRMERYRSWT